jgi:site-specific recombinase XerD
MAENTKKDNDIKALRAFRPQGRSERPLAEAIAAFRSPNAPPEGPAEPDVGATERLRDQFALALPAPAGVAPLLASLSTADGDPLRRFLAECQSPRTRETMVEALDRVAKLLGAPSADAVPWASLRKVHLLSIKAALAKSYSHRTCNVTLTAVRGVLRMAWDLELMTGDDYTRAASVKGFKVHRLPAGRWVPGDETAKLLAFAHAHGPEAKEFPASAYGAFLDALFGLILGAGLRASEAARLPIVAYDPKASTLRFVRKGNREVILALAEESTKPLDTWLAMRAELDVPGEALLVRVLPSGKLGERQLTRRTIERICKLVAKKSGANMLSPHDLRRTFCTNFLTAVGDVPVVQRFMGHASPETTALYDRRPLEADAAVRRKAKIMGGES